MQDKRYYLMVVLFDADFLLSRAFHIVKNDYTEDKFLKLFISQVKNSAIYLKATHCVVSFTDSESSFDNDWSNLYRKLKHKIHKSLSDLNIKHIEITGIGAEEVINSIKSNIRKSSQLDIAIVSKNKILHSLVDSKTCFYDPLAKSPNKCIKSLVDIEEDYQCDIRNILDVLALSGYEKYNVQGVTGIGVKKAAKLIAEYGDLENMEISRNIIPGKLGELLAGSIQGVISSRQNLILNNKLNIGANLKDFVFQASVKHNNHRYFN